MKKITDIVCLMIFGLLLVSACNVHLPEGSAVDETVSLDPTGLHETAVSLATVDAGWTQTAHPPMVTAVPSLTWTVTPAATLDRTRPVVGSQTVDPECNRAGAGLPIDVAIPDGTILAPGVPFTKTWRLENLGTCTWTRLYAVTFFSGNSLGAEQINTLPGEVPPGMVVDISIDMEAPLKAGVYQSNWMLSDDEGNLFGLGPNGDAPFWVRIEVVQVVTDTPQPTATATSTPVVYLSDVVFLADQDQLDLDTGEVNPEDTTGPDLAYLFGGDPSHVLTTMNDGQWVVFGEEQPTFNQCDQAEMSGNAVSFEEVPVGTYLCYRTSAGLPGRMMIGAFDADRKALLIQFLTWSVP